MRKDPRTSARRDWLFWSLVTGLFTTAVALFYPVVVFLRPRRGSGESKTREIVAPLRADELRVDEKGEWPSPFNFGGRPCLLIKTPEGEIRAFDGICTHVDCTVQYRPGKGDIFCSCHNGVYDLHGKNVSGPPPRPLESFRVTLRGERNKEEILVSRRT